MSAGVIAAHAVAGASYDALVLAQSPLFFWKMDEASFADFQLLVDSSGNSRQAQLHGSGMSVGGSLLTSGAGGSLILNGTTGTFANIGGGSNWLDRNSFTMTGIFNLRSTDVWQWNRWNDGPPRGWVGAVGSGGSFVSAMVGGTQRDLAVPAIATGIHAIAYRCLYNGSTTAQSLWVDGVSIASRTDSGSVTSTNQGMEMGRASGGTFSPNQQSRVAYIPSAMSDADIIALAAAR